jgi:sulfur carrier protein
MHLTINGAAENLELTGLSIAELLVLKKVEAPDMVSVQLNGEFVQRADFGSTQLKENDAVDFLYFMGGGGKTGAQQEIFYSKRTYGTPSGAAAKIFPAVFVRTTVNIFAEA